MDKIFREFKTLFKELGPDSDLINMYLVFIGVRSACLISNINIFYVLPKRTNLDIYYEIYPDYKKTKRDYPLVCLKNSWVSRQIDATEGDITHEQMGLYLGFNCFSQDWNNTKIKRHEIMYTLEGSSEAFYTEVCSSKPMYGMLSRIKFKAKEMNAALKLINNRYKISYEIKLIPVLAKKRS